MTIDLQPRVSARPTPSLPAPLSLRAFLALDERPALVEFVVKPAGRVALCLAFVVLLAAAIEPRMAVLVVAAAALLSYREANRPQVLFGATVAALMLNPVWYTNDAFEALLAEQVPGLPVSVRNVQRLATVVMFALTPLLLWFVARRPKSLLATRPVWCFLGAIAAGSLAALSVSPGWLRLGLLVTVKLAAAYMWFACYAIVDQRAKKRQPVALSLGTLHPFWGSYSAPIGKGAGYLSKLRCRDARELAVTQLKAIKLLIWSFGLTALSAGLRWLAAQLGIASLSQLIETHAQGGATPILAGWAALLLATALAAIELAAWGHVAVACARLAGFKLRRNTVRPLASRSLADFWNRYYFYFKELLVDFFFYPAFFRYFKRSPKLRTFFATFVAAGVGNAIYHFVRDIDLLFTWSPGAAIGGFSSYLFYCTLLALGIGVSQARTGGMPTPAASTHAAPTRARRVWSLVCVWGFVVCLYPFGGIEARTYTLQQRLEFMAHQFGVQS